MARNRKPRKKERIERQPKKEKDTIEMTGVITDKLPDTKFKVKLNEMKKPDGSDVIIIGHISGRMRKNYIRILPGDHVVLEISPYDTSKGRIIFRDTKPIKTAPPAEEASATETTPPPAGE